MFTVVKTSNETIGGAKVWLFGDNRLEAKRFIEGEFARTLAVGISNDTVDAELSWCDSNTAKVEFYNGTAYVWEFVEAENGLEL